MTLTLRSMSYNVFLVKVKDKKADICDGVPSTAALVFLYINNFFELHLDFW